MTSVPQATALPGAHWRRSTRSGDNGGSCVEVADLGDVIAVRDSKDPSGPALLVERDAWSSFVAGVDTARLEAR